jgi:hypothetical protein
MTEQPECLTEQALIEQARHDMECVAGRPVSAEDAKAFLDSYVTVVGVGERFRWWAGPVMWLAASLSRLVYRYGRRAA